MREKIKCISILKLFEPAVISQLLYDFTVSSSPSQGCLSVSFSSGKERVMEASVIAPSVFSNVRENREHADRNHVSQHFTK